MPRIRPSRGTHITIAHDDLPLTAGAIVPAGEDRTIFALPWLGRSLIGTTDNNYEGELDHVQPSATDIDYLLEAVNEFFGTELCRRPTDRRLRRRAAADLDRRHAQIGRHLSQGRAVRDLERADHDHRRQAHDLAADGQAGRRPARRARRPRRAVPDARDPARAADRSRASCRGCRASPSDRYAALAGRYGHDGRAGARRSPSERPELARPIVDGLPDLLAEVVYGVTRRAGAQRRRRAAAAHASRAARWPRALCAAGGTGPRRSRVRSPPELGWDEQSGSSARWRASTRRRAQRE